MMDSNIYTEDYRSGRSIDIAACSGIGQRDSQQDCAYWYADDRIVYAVVCDGMGGLGGGELASQSAIKVAQAAFHRREIRNEANSNTSNKMIWMLDAILEADRKVYKLQDDNGKRLGAGSTMASIWIRDKELYWASVGDSRVYIYRGDEILQLTTDLNYYHILNEKKEDGRLSDQEYQREAEDGEALISFLGLGNLDMIDRNTEPFQLVSGDVILICSDGLYRTIDTRWMGDILFACGRMEDVTGFVPMIIREHGDRYQDNYTCILIRVNDDDMK